MFIASMVKDGSGIATQVLRHTVKVKADLQKEIIVIDKDKHFNTKSDIDYTNVNNKKLYD